MYTSARCQHTRLHVVCLQPQLTTVLQRPVIHQHYKISYEVAIINNNNFYGTP